MYAVKGSWVGQTFALATASDSVGKKSRVRRSKEERKSMVETFIKRYQSSNNGSFPSLNLTHKEVGGSFYTVRELVREIIQENRVLGPARFSPELQHDDNVAGHYPLGSIATEPQVSFFNTENEQNAVFNHQNDNTTELSLDNTELSINYQDVKSFQGTREDETYKTHGNLEDRAFGNSESKDAALSKHEDCGSSELYLNSNELCLDKSKKIIDGFTNGNQISGFFHETDKMYVPGPLVLGSLEIDGDFVLTEVGKARVNLPVEEVVVENFPLRPKNNGIDGAGRLSIDFEDLTSASNDVEVEPVDLTNIGPYLHTISSGIDSLDHLTTKGKNGSQLSAEGSLNIESSYVHINGAIGHHTEHNLINTASDPTKSADINEDSLVFHDRIDQISSHGTLTSKTAEQYNCQSNSAPKGTTCLQNKSSKSNDKEPAFFSASGNNNRRDDKAVVASSQPVDRINLQSWERTAFKQQTNPLLAMLKTFADALVKFWS